MDAIPYGDIIIVAAIAALILLRYRAMLGEKSGRDKKDGVVVRPFQEVERIIQLPERKKSSKTPEIPEEGPFADVYAAMAALDRQFSLKEFINGARHAYEMVIEAFNANNRSTLKMLLDDATCQHFIDTLETQEQQGRKQQTTLVALKDTEIANAVLTGNVARMTVNFTSEQVILIRDLSGAILEGNPSHQQTVQDHWVFERNLNNADPAWKIVET